MSESGVRPQLDPSWISAVNRLPELNQSTKSMIVIEPEPREMPTRATPGISASILLSPERPMYATAIR